MVIEGVKGFVPVKRDGSHLPRCRGTSIRGVDAECEIAAGSGGVGGGFYAVGSSLESSCDTRVRAIPAVVVAFDLAVVGVNQIQIRVHVRFQVDGHSAGTAESELIKTRILPSAPAAGATTVPRTRNRPRRIATQRARSATTPTRVLVAGVDAECEIAAGSGGVGGGFYAVGSSLESSCDTRVRAIPAVVVVFDLAVVGVNQIQIRVHVRFQVDGHSAGAAESELIKTRILPSAPAAGATTVPRTRNRPRRIATQRVRNVATGDLAGGVDAECEIATGSVVVGGGFYAVGAGLELSCDTRVRAIPAVVVVFDLAVVGVKQIQIRVHVRFQVDGHSAGTAESELIKTRILPSAPAAGATTVPRTRNRPRRIATQRARSATTPTRVLVAGVDAECEIAAGSGGVGGGFYAVGSSLESSCDTRVRAIPAVVVVFDLAVVGVKQIQIRVHVRFQVDGHSAGAAESELIKTRILPSAPAAGATTVPRTRNRPRRIATQRARSVTTPTLLKGDGVGSDTVDDNLGRSPPVVAARVRTTRPLERPKGPPTVAPALHRVGR